MNNLSILVITLLLAITPLQADRSRLIEEAVKKLKEHANDPNLFKKQQLIKQLILKFPALKKIPYVAEKIAEWQIKLNSQNQSSNNNNRSASNTGGNVNSSDVSQGSVVDTSGEENTDTDRGESDNKNQVDNTDQDRGNFESDSTPLFSTVTNQTDQDQIADDTYRSDEDKESGTNQNRGSSRRLESESTESD